MIKFRSSKVIKRLTSSILCLIMVLSTVQLSGCDINAAQPEMKPGYYDTEYEGLTDKGATFLACGTGGRLDRIYEDSTVENIPLPIVDKDLTQVLISKDITLVAGVSGALAYSKDGKVFESSNGVGKEHIMGLAQFNGKYYACTYSGKILSSADGVTWKTLKKLTKKPIIAVAASDSCIMAVTNDTDVFKSTDGNNFESWNYNEVYKGLAEPLSFLNLVCKRNYLYFLGNSLENTGTPTVMLSYDNGETMTSAVSMKINDRPPSEFYPMTVYSVDLFRESLLSACDGGRVLTFTDCPNCNTVNEVSDADLRCIAVSENDVALVAGDNFKYAVLTEKDFADNANPD